MTGYASIRVAPREGGRVLSVLLDRPKGNVLDRAMLRELREALRANRAAAGLRLVVLRGAGGHFSFGASVEEHRKELAPEMLVAFHALARELAGFPVPVAALVEGRCLGGAFEIALCCHFVFATEDARFGCPEIKLGVFPPVLAAIGALRLGGALAERLLLTGQELDARAALACGFLTEVFPGGGDPEAALLDWYRRTLAPLSALALRQASAAVREGSGLLAALGAPLAEAERRYVAELLASHDANEGIEAFLAKRPPVWRDA